MKRIGKRTRDQAALICAIAASNWPHLYYQAENALGLRFNCTPGDVARAAFYEAQRRRPRFSSAQTAALAEAILRTGWSP